MLVHNHPLGVSKPSIADDDMTKRCQLMCDMHGVLLCDHLIYAQGGVFSYYQNGRMQQISHSYSIDTVLPRERGDEE